MVSLRRYCVAAEMYKLQENVRKRFAEANEMLKLQTPNEGVGGRTVSVVRLSSVPAIG